MSDDTENSQEATRRTTTKLQTEACKAKEDTNAKTVIPKRRRARSRHPIRAQTIDL